MKPYQRGAVACAAMATVANMGSAWLHANQGRWFAAACDIFTALGFGMLTGLLAWLYDA